RLIHPFSPKDQPNSRKSSHSIARFMAFTGSAYILSNARSRNFALIAWVRNEKAQNCAFDL
ncbi:MAG TPA: hypothetical protein VF627_05965, partial [Abditibacterium sp.]